ncbi:MAG: hypothetical protein AB1649_29225 [Chloroflexota bacterium]
MVLHFARIGIITTLLLLCMFYPFLPGEYDAMAMSLSIIAQLLGTVGLLLVPIGILWLVYEWRQRGQRQKNLPKAHQGYYFAITALIAASLVAMVVSLLLFLSVGPSLGVLTFALWIYTVLKAIPGLKRLRAAEAESIRPIPFYLIIIPIALLLFQVTLAGRATEFSRNHAIANSNDYIRDIEAYHDEYGHYPVSLAAMWKDYYPDVVGVEKFHYAPFGESYNLFFEQPRFLFDNIGTREWVVYNPNDEHRMFSHTAWFLLLTPEELERAQGWYAVHDATTPHWKYFWFD